MISIGTFINSKIKYIVDHIMPSDLDDDVKEGLKQKEEMISKVTEESVRESNPDIDETINFLNDQGISEEKYLKYLSGEIKEDELFDKPKPATVTIKYCLEDDVGELTPLEKELIQYSEGNKVTINLPSTQSPDGKKHKYVYVVNSLSGEMTDTYAVNNSSWSMLPQDANMPEDPNLIKIRFRGIIPGIYGIKTITDARECLPTPKDIDIMNNIASNLTWTDPMSLSANAISKGLLKSDDWFKPTLWTTILQLLPVSQTKIPEKPIVVNLEEGDVFNFSPKLPSVNSTDIAQNLIIMRCWLYYKKEWVELPYGLRNLTITDNDAFLTWKCIDFNQEHTGGIYGLTAQLYCKKFKDVMVNPSIYFNFINPQSEEKPPRKRSSCCKAKTPEPCDKGKTKCAIQHNPSVNKEWFNNMMDNLLHTELDPTLQAIKDLADALKAVVGTSTIWGQVTDSTGFTAMADAVKAECDAVIDRDIAVDLACKLIEDPSDTQTNNAIDEAIGDFNAIMDSTINKAVNTCCSGASSMSDAQFKALTQLNGVSDQIIMDLMGEFNQALSAASAMAGGGTEEMKKMEEAIKIAKQKIQIKAEAEAAKIPARFIAMSGGL